MNDVPSISTLKHIKCLIPIILCWLLYSSLYFYFKEDSYSVIPGVFTFVGEAGLDLLVAILAYFTWKNINNSTRVFFIFLTIAFAAAFLSDSIYNYLLNIKKVKIDIFTDSLFDIPFAVFLFFFMLAWLALFIKAGNNKTRKAASYLPYMFASMIIFVAFIFGSWKVKYASAIGLYQIIDTLFEALGFLFASCCLIRAKRLWIKYISVGYLIVIGSDFIIRYNVVENNTIMINPLETTWVLGLAFVALGFFLLKESRKTKAIY